jgi:hypothetical protein
MQIPQALQLEALNFKLVKKILSLNFVKIHGEMSSEVKKFIYKKNLSKHTPMKLTLLTLSFLLLSIFSIAQSKTTEALNKKYKDARVFFFYNNSLRMLNQSDDKDFDELIKDIEKMKLLLIDKSNNFSASDYKKITADYKTESFEEIMTSRHEGKNFDVFMKEKDGKTKGMLVLVSDSTNLYVLDIVGSIALNKVTKLYSTIDESSDVGKKIKNFTEKNMQREDDKK